MPRQTHNLPFAIDARMLGREGTGVATYARALAEALDRPDRPLLTISDPSCERPMVRAGGIERVFRWLEALPDRHRPLRRARQSLRGRDIFRLAQVHFDRHGTPLRLHAPGMPGIVHWTYPLPIRLEGWINVYTVHDAIPITHPELSQIEPVRHLRLLRMLAGHAEHLITVSEAARCDIVAALDCPADLVSACAPGLSIERGGAALPAGLTPRGYVLFVGSVEPRKNLIRLVEAHARSGLGLPLVVAGPDGWRADEITPALAASGVVRLPYVDRSTLTALIADARALLFPTLTEGFGLPVIEAMQLGTPVLTARGGATEEVAGGAALLADPLSIDDLSNAITRLADPTICADLTRRGLVRGADFTEAAFAARLDAIHARLLAGRGGQIRDEPLGPVATSD